MALSSFREARVLVDEIEAQPKKFLFGVDKPVSYCALSLITPIARDGKREKEYAQAHVYLLDRPGRGKTAVFNYLSAAIGGSLGRVDGRADMMPTDLTGYEYTDRLTGTRTLLMGPIHSNILYFDEITRTPSKAQGVCLGAMEGGHVVMYETDVKTGRLNAKSVSLTPISSNSDEKNMFFIVFATANPIEFEGTYPLSEAQKERFTYSFRMGLPDPEDEKMILAKNLMGKRSENVIDLRTLLEIQDMVKSIELSDQANEYIQRILVNSRPYSQDEEEYGRQVKRYATKGLVDYVNNYVSNGCSPRRKIHKEAAAKAFHFKYSNDESRVATVDDVRNVLPLIMEHVILLQPKSLGDNVTTRKIVQKLIEGTLVP